MRCGERHDVNIRVIPLSMRDAGDGHQRRRETYARGACGVGTNKAVSDQLCCDITVESEVTSQRKGPALSAELSSRDTDDT